MIHGRARARLGAVVLALSLVAIAHPRAAFSQNPPDSAISTTIPDSAAIPAAVGYVNDYAGIMSETSRARLEAFLDQVEKKTGAELAVLTVKNTAPLDPMEYKVRVFERWGLGKRSESNGLLMLVVVDLTTVRFETGYGLEGVLPDGVQSRIYREIMRPHFRNGDFAEGITQGMLASAARIAAEKNVQLEWDGRELRYSRTGRDRSGLSPGTIVMLIFFFILFTSIMGRAAGTQNRRRRRDWWWLGPGGFGGYGGGGWSGGGWGGGFGGGGGGGGFGGFGGGSSGGGGGGGGGSGGW